MTEKDSSRIIALRNRKRVFVVDTEEAWKRAKTHREAFFGKAVRNETELSFGWPKRLVYVGRALSEIYYSNKLLSGGRWETYKHVSEDAQDLFVNPDSTRLLGEDGKESELEGEEFELTGPMPKHVAVLANSVALQAELHDGACYEIRLPNSKLASAVHPGSGETFLLVYSREGVNCLITGTRLTVEEEGIGG